MCPLVGISLRQFEDTQFMSVATSPIPEPLTSHASQRAGRVGGTKGKIQLKLPCRVVERTELTVGNLVSRIISLRHWTERLILLSTLGSPFTHLWNAGHNNCHSTLLSLWGCTRGDMKVVCNLGGRMHMPRGYYGNVVVSLNQWAWGKGAGGSGSWWTHEIF